MHATTTHHIHTAAHTKRCSTCHETKPLEEFARKRGTHAARCKGCHNAYVREHYMRTREGRTEEIHEYNKAVTNERLVLVRALTEALYCEHCGKNVWITELNRAARNQVGKDRFRHAAENLRWSCRSRNSEHTGTLRATPTLWLRSLITGLMPLEQAFTELSAAVPVTDQELAAALGELLSRKLVFSPLAGWVQPTATGSGR